MTTAAQRKDILVRGIPAMRPPDRLIEFLRAEMLAGATRFELHRISAAMGIPAPLQPYPAEGPNEADEMGRRIFERAREDQAELPIIGATAFQVVSYRGEAANASASLSFKVNPEGGTTTGLEGPNPLDVIRQSQRHLEEREANQQALTLEMLASLHTSNDRTLAAMGDVIKGYQALNADARVSYEKTMDILREENSDLRAEISRHEQRRLETMALFEELTSKDHERKLEMAKVTRSEERKDRAVKEIFYDRILPVLSVKFLPPAMGAGGGKKNGANGTATNGASSKDAAGDDGPVPQFSRRQLRAIGVFLSKLEGPDLVAIGEHVSEGARQAFLDLMQVWEQEAEAAKAHANGTNGTTTNGATS